MGNRARAATLKLSHIHIPTKRDVLDWLKKQRARANKADAPLIAYCLFILGAAIFSVIEGFKG